jgi:kynurenine formamidase
MRLIDVSGPLVNGMWDYGFPHPAVRIEQLPRRHTPGYYSQSISMGVQSSTYVESAAHLRLEAPTIDLIPLERFYLEAVVLHVPLGADEHVTSTLLRGGLGQGGEELCPGDALLVDTGWDAMWNRPEFLTCPPHFTGEAIDWILESSVSLLGADTPRFDGASDPEGFFPRLMEGEMLILGPLVNLGAVRRARVRLICFPLKITDACASPCRAVIVEE